MKKIGKITVKKYIKQKGVRCPFCNSRDIRGDFVEIDEGGATQNISCLMCQHEWTDYYTPLTNAVGTK